MRRKILVSVTGINSSCENKIREIKKYKIKEFALFLGPFNFEKRQGLYSLLKKYSLNNIPFIHLRNDISPQEIDFFIRNYKTKIFNTHSQKDYPLIYNWSKYKKRIYLENVYNMPTKKELEEFAGICLDISHLENDRILNPKRFKKIVKIINEYKIGCNHISPVKNKIWIDNKGEKRFDFHYFKKLSEFDYIKKYPSSFFSNCIAIELENSIKEQLKVKKYIENLIKEIR